MALKFSKKICAAVAAVIASTLSTTFAGGPVNIPNGSFENPDASVVPTYHSLPIIYQTDWVHASQPADWPYPNDGFAWDTTAGVFNNNSFFNTPAYINSGVSGLQAGFFFNAFHNEITQELSTNWKQGSQYQLSFTAQGGGYAMPVGTQLKVWLYYVDGGNKILIKQILATNSFDNPSAGPISALLPYSDTTGPIPAAADGKPIGIAITSLAGSYDQAGDSGYWDIDNIQLGELPEPASLSFLAIGALGLCMRRRRRA